MNNLAFAYNIDTLKMCELVRLSINDKGGIDKENLRIQTRKYYQYNNHGRLPTLIYRSQPEYLKNPSGDKSKKGKIIEVFENTTPYDFLKFKYKNVTPTSRDLKLLEYLLVDISLKPAVVNVLIDYVLRKNNNKLNKVTSKPVTNTDESPVWFDEKISKENMSQEEELELESILKKYEN